MIVIYKHKKNGTPQALELRAAQMEPLGTIWNYLERPKGNWNSRRRLERALAQMERRRL